MKNKPTVTIGIPAFNEEANIKSLLLTLLEQNTGSFKLDEIIVSSDGSTDDTISQVKSINSKIIKIIDNQKRAGLAKNQNTIVQKAKGDILVLLNADLAVQDKNFLNKFITQIKKGNDLVCANLVPTSPKGRFERILYFGTIYTKRVFDNYQNGNNWATCHGAARAFSKKLYSQFRFKRSVGEDMYSYFYCKFNGFKYAYAKDAVVYYKLPETIQDHKKRSVRFMVSRKLVEDEFGKEFIAENFSWPKERFLLQGILLFITKPIDAAIYALVTLTMQLYSIVDGNKYLADKWQMSNSTRIVKI